MAYFNPAVTKIQLFNSAATTHTITLPDDDYYDDGDLLIIELAKEGSISADITLSGWTQIDQVRNAATYGCCVAWYKYASGTESNPTTSASASSQAVAVVRVIKDAPASSPIDCTTNTNSTSTGVTSITQSALNPTTDDVLMFGFCHQRATGAAIPAIVGPYGTWWPSVGGLNVADSGNLSKYVSAWGVHHDNTTNPAALKFEFGESRQAQSISYAIKNKSGGKVQAHMDTTESAYSMIDRAYTYGLTTFPDATRSAAATATSVTTPAGASLTISASPSMGVVGQGHINNLFMPTIYYRQDVSGVGKSIEVTTSSTYSLTNKYLIIAATIGSVVDVSEVGRMDNVGLAVAVIDSSNNYRLYNTLAVDTLPTWFGYQAVVINPNQTTTMLGSSGSINLGLIDTVQLITQCDNENSNCDTYISGIHALSVLTIAGGGSGNYLTWREAIPTAGAPHGIRLLDTVGENALVSMIPLKIGGGDPVYMTMRNTVLEFARQYDLTVKAGRVNAVDGDMGITFDLSATDAVDLRDSMITGPSQFYWDMGSSSSSATILTSGHKISGDAVVTLGSMATWDGMIFTGNQSINANSSDFTSCTFNSLQDQNDFITNNSGTSFDACTFDVTTLSAGNRMISVADPSVFTNCTFNGGASAGHAIRITTAGTYTFDGNLFSGFGANGTTSAAIYNDSGGAVTLNISGGGDTPTYRNGTSAATTIVNAVTVTVTVLDTDGNPIQNARVLLEESPGGTDVLTGLTNASGIATTSYAFTGTQAVQGWVRKASGSPYYKQSTLAGNITSAGYDVTVTMVDDE